jgi:hypothetical protein
MAKYCSEENDMYGVIDWAVEAYYKWKSDGQPECVDPEILNFYIMSSSLFTGEKRLEKCNTIMLFLKLKTNIYIYINQRFY